MGRAGATESSLINVLYTCSEFRRRSLVIVFVEDRCGVAEGRTSNGMLVPPNLSAFFTVPRVARVDFRKTP